MGGRIARTQRQRPAEVVECVDRPVPADQRHAAIDQRLRIGRLRLERPVVGGDRLVRAAEVPEDVAAVEMGRRVAGPERQRPVLGGQRIGEPAELLQRHAAVAVRLGEGGTRRTAASNSRSASRGRPCFRRMSPRMLRPTGFFSAAPPAAVQRGRGLDRGRRPGCAPPPRSASRRGAPAARPGCLQVVVHAAGKLAEPAANCEGPKAPALRAICRPGAPPPGRAGQPAPPCRAR